MLKEESEKRQEELTEIVYKLSDKLYVNDEDLRNIVIQLKRIYSGKWRHRYSEFLSIILDIADDGNPHSTEFLSENLEKVREFIETDYIEGKKEFTSLHYYFTKLSDHLNLEIGRLNHYTSTIQATLDIKAKFDTIQAVVDDVEKKLVANEKKIKNSEENVDKLQISAITVIGLFSAIIMSFFGGISFSQQALEALSMSSPVRLVFVLSLLGFVLINVLFSILYIVGKLTGKKICSKCSNAKDADSSCECKRPSFLCKLINKYPYMLWTNSILVLLMGITSSIWVSTLFFGKAINSNCVIWIIIAWVLVIIVSIFIIYSIVKKTKSSAP